MNEQQQTTAMTIREKKQSLALANFQPQNLVELHEIAGWIAKSKVYNGVDNQDTAFAIMLRGIEIGIPMSVALTEIKVIKGRISHSSQLLESLAGEDPSVEYFHLVESTDKHSIYKAKRKGEPEIVHKFDIEDAIRAKLVNRGEDQSDNNWNKWRKVMLRRACARELARIISPARTLGMLTFEEAEEIVPEETQRPAPVRPLAQQPVVVVTQPASASATPAKVVEAVPEETDDAAMLRLEKALRAATSADAAKQTIAEIQKRWPSKENPRRRMLAGVLKQRQDAKWAAEKPPEPEPAKVEEPPHDPETSEVKPQRQREPGDDDEEIPDEDMVG